MLILKEIKNDIEHAPFLIEDCPIFARLNALIVRKLLIKEIRDVVLKEINLWLFTDVSQIVQ